MFGSSILSYQNGVWNEVDLIINDSYFYSVANANMKDDYDSEP